MRSMTEGLSISVYRLSYPLRHFVTPPLTIRGGIFYYGSLVQRELACASMTEGLSIPVYRLSYPLRHFVTPPLTIRGGKKKGAIPPLSQKREVAADKKRPESRRSRYQVCDNRFRGIQNSSARFR